MRHWALFSGFMAWPPDHYIVTFVTFWLIAVSLLPTVTCNTVVALWLLHCCTMPPAKGSHPNTPKHEAMHIHCWREKNLPKIRFKHLPFEHELRRFLGDAKAMKQIAPGQHQTVSFHLPIDRSAFCSGEKRVWEKRNVGFRCNWVGEIFCSNVFERD